MGAFLVVQPAPGRPAPEGFGRARDHFVLAKGLRISAEGPCYVKFARRNGSGAAPAVSKAGWLLSCGSWHHPDCGVDDNAALLRLAERRGVGEFDRLDGTYALVAGDSGSGDLVVETDHFGRLHLYASESEEGLLLGTSSVALARARRAPPDPLSLWEFLASGTLFAERTPYLGVRRLLGARRYRFAGGRCVSVEERASRILPPQGPPERPATAEELVSALRSGLEAFAPAASRPLPDLTGGLDSRLVVGLLHGLGRCFDVTVTGDADHADVRIAAELARRLGLKLLREPRERGLAAQADFAGVLAAAARVDGEYDAIEYAAIAAIHEAHSAEYGMSVNGSGGEVFRNYWWTRRHLGRTGGDAAGALLRRFTHALSLPPFLPAAPDPSAHFRAMLDEVLAARGGEPLPALFDHAYLHLRMQCWQGAIGSATNEIWCNASPLLLRRPLQVLYRLPPEERLGGRLLRRILGGCDVPFRHVPLASGFPPLPIDAGTLVRFLPGALRWPASVVRRARAKWGRRDRDPEAATLVDSLMAGGAGDWLEPRSMALLPLLDRPRYEGFLAASRGAPGVPVPLLGRLISFEYAARAAIQD